MTVPLRAAFYLRVSTARQAAHDVSIPDQKRQGEGYCALHAATSWSRPSSRRALPPPTTAGRSSSACGKDAGWGFAKPREA